MIKDAKVLNTKTLYEGYNTAREYELCFPSQAPGREYGPVTTREMLHVTDAVFVLIHAPDIDSFVMVREFRTGVFFNKGHDDPFLISCVAGAIDGHDSPEDTARRETEEEAGVKAGDLTHIASVYSSPGRTTEKTHVFLTRIAGTPQTGLHGLAEEGEEIASLIVPRAEAYRMLDERRTMDAMTVLALNWFRATYG